ncbi:MAG: glycosyltransferase family 4 protein [Magnetococcales bacterium]|nr:glycosyltransferase family 4 protein [Magnetococcales bacterium]
MTQTTPIFPPDPATLKQIHLVLFFTQNMSLLAWEKGGGFHREVALYRALLPHLGSITFVTYGDKRDLAFASRLPGITLICNRWKLPLPWYQRYLTWMAPPLRKTGAVFKTNQMRGSDIPAALARKLSQRFLSRSGFSFSFTMKQREGREAPATQQALELEKRVFEQADRIVVTTALMKTMIINDHGIDPQKITRIPNYVDTDLFAPNPTREPSTKRLIFIGRLEAEKNLFNLIKGLGGLDLECWLVGAGTLKEKLQQAAQQGGVTCRFLGSQPHEALPKLLNSATALILPSLYEGHPKTLLEAMACGLPVIGGDIPAIREIITHGENGLLTGLEVSDIHQSVQQLFSQPDLQTKLGNQARRYALDHLSLPLIVQQELALLAEMSP